MFKGVSGVCGDVLKNLWLVGFFSSKSQTLKTKKKLQNSDEMENFWKMTWKIPENNDFIWNR